MDNQVVEMVILLLLCTILVNLQIILICADVVDESNVDSVPPPPPAKSFTG